MVFFDSLLIELRYFRPIRQTLFTYRTSLFKPLICLLIQRWSSVFFMSTFEIISHGNAPKKKGKKYNY